MNCSTRNKLISIKRARFLMNTFCSIEAEGEDALLVEAYIEEAFAEIKRLEHLFSRYLDASDISRINLGAANCAIPVEKEIFQLIARALEFSRLTYGAFDVSLAAALDFWRLCEDKNILPTGQQLKELKPKIGYQNITLDFNAQTVIFAKQGLKIDLGALAKGHAIDRAVEILKNRGLQRAQLNFGGNIYVLGAQPQKIAIRNPLRDDEVITTVNLTNTSISTSANYERNFNIAGKRFSHIINPLTARPAESDILSVSIISEDATLADALSTALFVLGVDKAKAMLKHFKGIEAVIISRSRFTNRLKFFQLKGGL